MLELTMLARPVIAVVAVGLAGAGGALAHAAARRDPSCATRTLVVWLDTNQSGTAGSTYDTLELTNLSGRRCTIAGYPGVSATDLAGRRLGSPAGRDPHTRPTRVSLAPGRTASAVLRIADASVFPKARCRPVTAARLRVYPPNETQSKTVPFPFRACSRVGPVFLHVQAVTAAR